MPQGNASWLIVSLVLIVGSLGFSAFGLYRTVAMEHTSKPIPIATHLRLQFNAIGMIPVAVALENIRRWYTLVNVTTFVDQIGQQVQTRNRTIFLLFDHPVEVKQIRIDGSGARLPVHEVKDSSAWHSITHDLVGVVVDIRVA